MSGEDQTRSLSLAPETRNDIGPTRLELDQIRGEATDRQGVVNKVGQLQLTPRRILSWKLDQPL
jgi:hypothetical protein